MIVRAAVLLLSGLFLSFAAHAQEWVWAPDFEVGDTIPAIAAPDQNGDVKTLSDLAGEKGLVLVLSRSFDWCPYCIAQLQKLVDVAPQFAELGVTVAAMTYDSQDILKAAEEDYSVNFPLLQDIDVKHVTALGILNEQYEPGQRAYGIPEPGIFLLSPDGTIRFKFADQDYRMRPDFSLVLQAATSLLGI
ncbi:MAG: peroxiredoxin family protein [Pseudohongiella sp.]|nr:peroxiredoxin family protein [Pseudohongiella sp.]